MGSAVVDAFTSVESGVSDVANGAVEWGTWKILLERAPNLKGLAQIHLQSFHGRSGMQSFQMMTATQKDGGAVLALKDIAHVDADAVAKQMYSLALDHSRREACDSFRVQLYKWSTGGAKAKMVKGAYAGLRINPVTGAVIWNASAEQTPESKWKELCEFLTTEMQNAYGKQGELLVQSTASLITTLQASDEIDQRRRRVVEEAAAANLPTPPAEVTERLKLGIDTLSKTVKETIRWYMWNEGKPMPPSMDVTATEKGSENHDADNAKLQGELLALFESLDGEVHDKIRPVMGTGNWDGIMAVLRGPLQQFVIQFNIMGPLLAKQTHDGALDTILPADKLAELRKILG